MRNNVKHVRMLEYYNKACFIGIIVGYYKVRDEEMEELEKLLHDTCEMQVPGGVENSYGKVNILLQSFVSRQYLDSFSLVSDQSYVAQVSF
jgi:hypothetical protein